MNPAFIFDIDGTLADNSHRQHLIAAHPKNWKIFHESLHLDAPIQEMRILNKIVCRAEIWIILCTGRPNAYRKQTIEWLTEHNFYWNKLYMQDDKPQSAIEYKREILRKIRADGFDPIIAIEDRKQLVDMYRAEGIMCLQCADNNF